MNNDHSFSDSTLRKDSTTPSQDDSNSAMNDEREILSLGNFLPDTLLKGKDIVDKILRGESHEIPNWKEIKPTVINAAVELALMTLSKKENIIKVMDEFREYLKMSQNRNALFRNFRNHGASIARVHYYIAKFYIDSYLPLYRRKLEITLDTILQAPFIIDTRKYEEIPYNVTEFDILKRHIYYILEDCIKTNNILNFNQNLCKNIKNAAFASMKKFIRYQNKDNDIIEECMNSTEFQDRFEKRAYFLKIIIEAYLVKYQVEIHNQANRIYGDWVETCNQTFDSLEKNFNTIHFNGRIILSHLLFLLYSSIPSNFPKKVNQAFYDQYKCSAFCNEPNTIQEFKLVGIQHADMNHNHLQYDVNSAINIGANRHENLEDSYEIDIQLFEKIFPENICNVLKDGLHEPLNVKPLKINATIRLALMTFTKKENIIQVLDKFREHLKIAQIKGVFLGNCRSSGVSNARVHYYIAKYYVKSYLTPDQINLNEILNAILQAPFIIDTSEYTGIPYNVTEFDILKRHIHYILADYIKKYDILRLNQTLCKNIKNAALMEKFTRYIIGKVKEKIEEPIESSKFRISFEKRAHFLKIIVEAYLTRYRIEIQNHANPIYGDWIETCHLTFNSLEENFKTFHFNGRTVLSHVLFFLYASIPLEFRNENGGKEFCETYAAYFKESNTTQECGLTEVTHSEIQTTQCSIENFDLGNFNDDILSEVPSEGRSEVQENLSQLNDYGTPVNESSDPSGLNRAPLIGEKRTYDEHRDLIQDAHRETHPQKVASRDTQQISRGINKTFYGSFFSEPQEALPPSSAFHEAWDFERGNKR